MDNLKSKYETQIEEYECIPLVDELELLLAKHKRQVEMVDKSTNTPCFLQTVAETVSNIIKDKIENNQHQPVTPTVLSVSSSSSTTIPHQVKSMASKKYKCETVSIRVPVDAVEEIASISSKFLIADSGVLNPQRRKVDKLSGNKKNVNIVSELTDQCSLTQILSNSSIQRTTNKTDNFLFTRSRRKRKIVDKNV